MKKYIAVALFALIIFVGGARPAVAGLPVIDVQQLLKEFTLDTTAWAISSALLGNMTLETANWANTGFEQMVRTVVVDPLTNLPTVELAAGGDATFVMNPGAFFRNLSTDSVGKFIEEITAREERGAEVFFEDFRNQLLRDIAREAQTVTGDFFDQFRTTFERNGGVERREAFLRDFTVGGWATFLETVRCPNDYACARLVVLGEARGRMQEAVEQKREELAQGGGFLTIRQCAERNEETGECLRYGNVTPGQLIGQQVAQAARIEFERTGEVDEITEAFLTILEDVLNNLITAGLSELEGAINQHMAGMGGAGAAYDRALREGERQMRMRTRQVDGCIAPSPVDMDGTLCVDTDPVLAGNQTRVVLTRDLPFAEVTITRADFATYTGPVTIDGFGDHRGRIVVTPNIIELTETTEIVTEMEDGTERRTVVPVDPQSVVLRIEIPAEALAEIENLDELSGHILIGEADAPLRLRIDVQGEERREAGADDGGGW